MRSKNTTSIVERRAGERGAALITALLLSLLLLAAGASLLLTTTMTGITARDSTSEMQAYYAAEAGVASTLEILRGNVDTDDGTRGSFRNVLCSPNLWATTAGSTILVSADPSERFQVTDIFDPDNRNTVTVCADPDYQPDRLIIRVLGLGPRNSQKRLEMAIDRYTLDYPVNATVTLPNTSGDPLPFDLGGSNVTSTSGEDFDGHGDPIAAFAISDADKNTTNNVIDGCDPDGSNCGGSGANVTPPDPLVLTGGNTPSFLQSVTAARTFLYGPEGMKQAAINQGRYFTTEAAAKASIAGLGATNTDGVFTFIDGDCTLGPGNPTGQGTLIVTGKLTLDGNFNFNGVIMVLGAGEVYRSGGGHGNIYGAIFVAKFAAVGASTDKFQAPTFDTSGGGTANIQYSTDAIDRAKAVGGHAVKGVCEY